MIYNLSYYLRVPKNSKTVEEEKKKPKKSTVYANIGIPKQGQIAKVQRIRVSTGIQVFYEEWSKSKGFIKNSGQNPMAFDALVTITENLAAFFDIANHVPSKRELEAVCTPYRHQVCEPESRFFADQHQVFQETVGRSKKWSVTTKNKHKRAGELVLYFAEQKGNKGLQINELTKEFFVDFKEWLETVVVDTPRFNKAAYSLNSTATIIKKIRAFLNWAEEKFSEKLNAKSWTARFFHSDYDSLKFNELLAVINKRLHDVTIDGERYSQQTLEKWRDRFVFQCCTGVRVSDLSQITPYNFIEGNNGRVKLRIVPKKTVNTKTTSIEIPLNCYAERIYSEYQAQIPQCSDQRYNDFIKVILKVCGIDRRSEAESTRHQHLHEVAASHLCRRTFVSLCLQEGILPSFIQGWTGHSTLLQLYDYMHLKPDQYYEQDVNIDFMKNAIGRNQKSVEPTRVPNNLLKEFTHEYSRN